MVKVAATAEAAAEANNWLYFYRKEDAMGDGEGGGDGGGGGG